MGSIEATGSTLSQPPIFAWSNTYFAAEDSSEMAWASVTNIESLINQRGSLKLPIRDYLASILPGLAELPVKRVAELTPAAWAARS
jgi:hypothetical protein